MKVLNYNYIRLNKLLLLGCCLMLFPIMALAQDTGLSATLQDARNAGIESSVLEEIQQRASQRGLSDAELSQLIRPAISLAEQNLPSDAIFTKALEGLSKGVPASRISPVLQSIGNATRRSAPIVDPWIAREEVKNMSQNSGMISQQFRDEMIKSVSKNLQANVPREEISALLDEVISSGTVNEANAQSIAAAVRVFPELPTTSQNPGMSRAFVIRSLKGGFTSSELQKLPAAMAVAQQRSQLPAQSVIEGISKKMKSGVPANQILQQLFNGTIGGGPPGGIPPGLENRPDNRGNNGQGQGGGQNG